MKLKSFAQLACERQGPAKQLYFEDERPLQQGYTIAQCDLVRY